MSYETTASARLVEFYGRMCTVRVFEERVAQLYRNAEIPGFLHTSLGQEAVAVGFCTALRDGDTIATTHRGHGHCLAKGADPNRAMAELFGRLDGLCKGKGGSMHIADPRLGIIGANAIVGASLPLATGAALSSKVKGTGSVAVAFFGDGAVNQGAFHESINLAAIWQLPVLFVCENNLYAEFTDSRTTSLRRGVAELGPAYGIRSLAVDGNDVTVVYETALEAASACRSGTGPVLVEARTYRFHGHYEGDPQGYKSDEEVARWRDRDPLAIARAQIQAEGLATANELDAIYAEAVERVDSAEAFARQSPFPELQETFRDVYGD